MNSLKVPVAFIGYGRDPRTGEFYQKVCKECADKARAISEAFPLRVLITTCDRHLYETTAKRIGD